MNESTILVIQHPTDSDSYGVIGRVETLARIYDTIPTPVWCATTKPMSGGDITTLWLTSEQCDALEDIALGRGLTVLSDNQVG